MKPKGSRSDSSQAMQKCFLRVSVEQAHAGFIDFLPEERRTDAPGVGWFRSIRPYWVKLRERRHVIGCVCVHHAKHHLLEGAAKKLRRKVHRSRCGGGARNCKLGERCDCHCAVCTTDMPLLQAAVCSAPEQDQPCLACVLQECSDCGLQRALVCQNKEANNQAYLKGNVRLMRTVTRSVPGYEDKNKIEPVSVACSLKEIFDEISDSFSFTLMHDYLATRLANQFHFDLYNLPIDEEVWVMDFIENFTCFQEFALQQDHYGDLT